MSGVFGATAWVAALAMLLALLIDHWLGEPPTSWHPVVGIGRYLGWVGARIAPCQPSQSVGAHARAFASGAGAWGVGAIGVTAIAWGVQRALMHGPSLLQAAALGVVLKPLLAWALLKNEVQAVEAALGGSLAAGRERLAWLVSRDVSQLDATAVREGAIESLAENLNDSVVAPLFWFAIAGLPGAALYRFANTADAMWGYRGMREGRYWTWAGKWAARADDVLSFVPARLTGLLLALLVRRYSLTMLWREARRTPSPNSGWPMAAMALALGVRLGKPCVYTLYAAGRAPDADDTRRACRLGDWLVGMLPVVAALLALGMAHA